MQFNFVKNIDRFIFVLTITLVIFGLISIYSTSFDSSKFVNFEKQVVFAVVGIFLMISAMFVADYRVLKNYSGILYLAAVLVLIFTVIFAQKTRGVYSWVDVGVLNFQPAEFIKIILVIILAKYFSVKNVGDFRYVVISGIYAGILIALIALQPDFGMAAIFLIIWLSMSIAGGIKLKHMAIILVMISIAGMTSWNFVLKDYQKARITTFMDPGKDPLGRGYNVIQSKIAIGSGGINGKGFGHGTQSQLNFLPEKYSDFIFAALAEESGFFGVTLLFFVFACVFRQIFITVKRINDSFGKLLVFGFGVMIFSNFFINIAANLSLLPVTGVPLPFISYGGSSLIANLLALGVIQNIIIRNRETYNVGQNSIDIEETT